MSRYPVIIFLLLTIFLVSCNSFPSVDSGELEKIEVSQTSTEVSQGDFIYRLISEKAEYSKSEEPEIYAELEYIGEQDEVTISHSSSPFFFPVEETMRGYSIEYVMGDIGRSTTFERGEPYREEYVKTGGYSPDQASDEYVAFMENFLHKKGFPPGYYHMNGYADFAIRQGEDRQEWKNYKIKARIDFKVMQ